MPMGHVDVLKPCPATNTVELRNCLRAGFKSRNPGKPYPPWLPMLNGLDMDFAAAVLDRDERGGEETLNLFTIRDIIVIVEDAYMRQPVLIDRALRRAMGGQYK